MSGELGADLDAVSDEGDETASQVVVPLLSDQPISTRALEFSDQPGEVIVNPDEPVSGPGGDFSSPLPEVTHYPQTVQPEHKNVFSETANSDVMPDKTPASDA